MILRDAVASTLSKLDDEDAIVWSNAEIILYVKDGYDQFCRRTKCLFDMWVIPNVPQSGNWQTDLERYLAEQKSGMGLTDNRMAFTSEFERDLGVGGNVSDTQVEPVMITSPTEGSKVIAAGLPTKVSTGRIPSTTTEVLRVVWDEKELIAEDSAHMRLLDIQYERRDGGDPQLFTMDKDGPFTIRFIPPARGDAGYPTVSGSWGTMTFTDNTAVTVNGSWGIFRDAEGAFPAWGPHGTPTEQHPSDRNIIVELARLGRSLDRHPFEIPDQYVKFIVFWAMSRALKRSGPGQDLKLSKHYVDRFDMGTIRLQNHLKKIQTERVLQMGSVASQEVPFGGLGTPQLPYPYGPRGRRIT